MYHEQPNLMNAFFEGQFYHLSITSTFDHADFEPNFKSTGFLQRSFIPKQYFGYLDKGQFSVKDFTMSDIQQLIAQIRAFRDARDWEQFHNSKDLAVALSIEASELLELFLWKGNIQSKKPI